MKKLIPSFKQKTFQYKKIPKKGFKIFWSSHLMLIPTGIEQSPAAAGAVATAVAW